MAHQLDYSNDRVNYAYVKEHGSVWHGEGNILPLHAPLIEWKKEAGHGQFVGYMAHEVEEVAPHAVITRPDGFKMVNYGALQ